MLNYKKMNQKISNMINKSKKAFAKREYEKALKICDDAVKIYEKNNIPNYKKTKLYISLKKYQNSLQRFQKSLKNKGNDIGSFLES